MEYICPFSLQGSFVLPLNNELYVVTVKVTHSFCERHLLSFNVMYINSATGLHFTHFFNGTKRITLTVSVNQTLLYTYPWCVVQLTVYIQEVQRDQKEVLHNVKAHLDLEYWTLQLYPCQVGILLPLFPQNDQCIHLCCSTYRHTNKKWVHASNKFCSIFIGNR